MATEPRTWELEALTEVWTGSVQGFTQDKKGNYKEQVDNTCAVPASLLGSIRWWLEVLVRGLGGPACDPSPSQDNRAGPCPAPRKQPHEPGHRCVVCELFGCTGWARKFRLDVLDGEDRPKRDAIKAGAVFKLRFTPLRPVKAEEWALLELTLRLIAQYGALGGKTAYKPSDEENRQQAPHHRDYGLIAIQRKADLSDLSLQRASVERHVASDRWRPVADEGFAWASLRNMWFVEDAYLARQGPSRSTFNAAIGRPEPKKRDAGGPRYDSWLAGQRAKGKGPASKKVFSFKHPPRTFGFVQPGEATPERLHDLLTRNDASRRAIENTPEQEVTPGDRMLDSLLRELDGEETS